MDLYVHGNISTENPVFSYDFRPPPDLENTICDSYIYGYRAIPGRYIDVNSSNRWVTYTSKKLGRYISNSTTADVSYTGNQFRATYTPSGGTAVTLTSGSLGGDIFYTPSQVVTLINNQLNSFFGSGKVVCSFDFDNDTWLYTFTCPTAGDTISIDHTFEWGPTVFGFNSTKTGNVITSDTVVFQTSTIKAALEINVGTSLDSLVAQLNIVFQNNNAKAWNINFTAEVVNNELIRILGTLPTDEIVLSSIGTIWSRLGFPTDISLPNSIESTPVINTVAVEDYTWLSSGWRQPTIYLNTYLGPGPIPVYIPSGQQTADFTVSGIMTSNAIYDVEFFLRLVSRTH